MSKYDEAKEIAQKILELEKTRKSAVDDLKGLKEELLVLVTENSIENIFEFNGGIVFLEKSVTYKPADSFTSETEVKSKSNDISDDFIEAYFNPDLKLNKHAKKALREGESDELLAVLVEEPKQSIKVKLSA